MKFVGSSVIDLKENDNACCTEIEIWKDVISTQARIGQ